MGSEAVLVGRRSLQCNNGYTKCSLFIESKSRLYMERRIVLDVAENASPAHLTNTCAVIHSLHTEDTRPLHRQIICLSIKEKHSVSFPL